MTRKRKALSAGRFESREELTCHVWSIHRQQVFPNARAISHACGVSMEAVKKIIVTEEGLDTYLEHGCLTGGRSVSSGT
jgi:hypothetical protein